MSHYTPSELSGELGETFRRHMLTRWMSRDLKQAAVDFCRNLGLAPVYAESSKDGLTRYLFCHLPAGTGLEVRTGRSREQFDELDRVNQERNWKLLTLHVSENAIYSAIWIDAGHYEAVKQLLSHFRISPAGQVV